jgi:hypothetical protein
MSDIRRLDVSEMRARYTFSQLEHDPNDCLLEAIREIDRDEPMPVPEPRCGQVWAKELDELLEEFIVERVIQSKRHQDVYTSQGCYHAWPPENSVLVAGPGSPWAPPDWEPPKGDK